MAKHKKSVFGGTHRPIRGDRMYRSLSDARDEAGFDHTPPPGCLFLLLGAVCASALAVIGVFL